MLVAIWYLTAQTGSSNIAEMPILIKQLDDSARAWCFWAFAFAFAVKTPLIPFHGWQAPVYAATPAGGAVLLAGVMAKLGTYGFIRFVLPFFPDESVDYAWLFIALGAIGVVGGASVALVQKDLKKLLAFSSLSHLGLIVVGIFSFQTIALSGAVVQMVAHGFAAAALFLLVGILEHRHGKRGIEDFGGLAPYAPVFTVFFIIAAMTAVALPGTAGFIGEFMLLIGSFNGLQDVLGSLGIWVTIFIGLSLIFGAVYTLRAVQKVLFGQPNPDTRIADLSSLEGLAIAPLLIASIALGFYATPITTSAETVVEHLSAEARSIVDGDDAKTAVLTSRETKKGEQ